VPLPAPRVSARTAKTDAILDQGIALGLSKEQLVQAATASDAVLMRAGFNALLAGKPRIRDFFIGIIEARNEIRTEKGCQEGNAGNRR